MELGIIISDWIKKERKKERKKITYNRKKRNAKEGPVNIKP